MKNQLHLPLSLLALLAAIGCTDEAEPPPVFVEPRLGLELVGEVANEWLGYSVAAAGDVTGDGQVDLLLSEHASGVGGRVSLLAGPLEPGQPWRDRVVATFVGEDGFAKDVQVAAEQTLHPSFTQCLLDSFAGLEFPSAIMGAELHRRYDIREGS